MSAKEFLDRYLGMIIGIIIALLIIAFNLVFEFECLALIVVCAWLGYYIQKNKPDVKERLKRWIDKF